MAGLQADVDTLMRSGYLNAGPGSGNALQVRPVLHLLATVAAASFAFQVMHTLAVLAMVKSWMDMGFAGAAELVRRWLVQQPEQHGGGGRERPIGRRKQPPESGRPAPAMRAPAASATTAQPAPPRGPAAGAVRLAAHPPLRRQPAHVRIPAARAGEPVQLEASPADGIGRLQLTYVCLLRCNPVHGTLAPSMCGCHAPACTH